MYRPGGDIHIDQQNPADVALLSHLCLDALCFVCLPYIVNQTVSTDEESSRPAGGTGRHSWIFGRRDCRSVVIRR